MQFEWNDAKNRANIRKHGISFERASAIFLGLTVDVEDEPFEAGEHRTTSIGMIGGVLILTVIHTDRNGSIRIISARKATTRERTIYEAAL